MDTWAPVTRYAHEGLGYWTNDTGTLALNTSGTVTGQSHWRPTANATETAAHDAVGNQWTDAYGEVTAVLNTFTGNTNRKLGVWLRVADASNCYTVQADGGVSGNGNMTVSKVVAGVVTSLGTTTFVIGGDTVYVTMRAEVQDNSIRAFWRGQHVFTVQDSTYTGPGFVSMFLRSNTTTGDVQASRWEAGPLRPNYVAAGYTPMAGPFRTGQRLR